jgi:D-3-phosphoglycerate dehydrogenase
MAEPYRVAISPDLFAADGSSVLGDVRLDLLDNAPGVEWRSLGPVGRELTADDLRGLDALALFGQKVTDASLQGNDRLAIVARIGVGYDNVDVAACTRHGVMLTITPGAVRRPMALANLTFLLALAHRLLEQDRLIRAGQWSRKFEVRGSGLTGRTVGTIGFGNIAQEFVALAAPLGLRFLASDPFASPPAAEPPGSPSSTWRRCSVRATSWWSPVPSLPDTLHLLNAERLGLMKPTAFLISTARGPIVDQAALTGALRERRIAGAGLDVFEREPIDPDDPLLALDKRCPQPAQPRPDGRVGAVERGLGVRRHPGGGCRAGAPHVVNREVLESPVLAEKLRRYREALR